MPMSLTSRLKRPLSRRELFERLGGGADADDFRALFGQQPLQVFARIRFIIHREDA